MRIASELKKENFDFNNIILTALLAGFLRVMEIRGSHGILRFHFQGLESHGM